MQIRTAHGDALCFRTGALVVPLFSDCGLEGAASEIDQKLGGAITDALRSGEIEGKLGETIFLHAMDEPFRRVLVIGLGRRDRFEPHLLARYSGSAVRYLGRRNIGDIAIVVPSHAKNAQEAQVSLIVEGAITGAFEASVYQKQPKRRLVSEAVAVVAGELDSLAIERGISRGIVLGEAINTARTLAITPANDMTPAHLAIAATNLAQEADLGIDVLDEERAKQEGMGAYLSVAQGSSQSPKFIVLSYRGDPASDELVALVGKGVTFDTGGISIKPSLKMEDMKYDMCGGAGVIAALYAIGRLKPSINVVGIVPATENMPSGMSTKPGDIVTAMDGKTIEVINTDAEGRLILCDALTYAKKLGATRIVDAATLTGACVVALGHATSAAMTNDDGWLGEFLAAAKDTGERYWHMPYHEEYTTAMESDIADLRNTGGAHAGALTAGAFLRAFVGDTPWIHLDIAGTAHVETENAWQAKGPTGTPVRALVSLIERIAGARLSNGNGAAKLPVAH